MTEALVAALFTLHDAPEKVIPILVEFFGGSAVEGEETYRLLEKYFTADGKAAPEAVRCALEMLNQQLPAGHKPGPDDIYDNSMLPG